MQKRITATELEVQELKRRLAVLYERAEGELRQKLKEARAVVADLEMQLSEVTGRPSATQIKASDPKRWAPITDAQLEVQILFVLQKEGGQGMNATTIAERLNQNPGRVRKFIKDNPKILKRVGTGPRTRYFVP
jgi:hypothetical protein